MPRFSLRLLIALALVLVLLPGCDNSSDGAADTTLATATTTTTTAATTTTTQVPTTTTTETTVPPITATDWEPYEWEMFHPPSQSVGYSCGEDAAAGCGGSTDMVVTHMRIGSDDADRAVDFIDFFMTLQPGADSDDPTLENLGDVNAPYFADTGHGVRVVQLERRPPTVQGGEAWLELTVSSVSATEPVPVSRRYSTHLIDDVVLVESTGDMMRWIITLRYPGTYLHRAGYAGAGTTTHNWLFFEFRRG